MQQATEPDTTTDAIPRLADPDVGVSLVPDNRAAFALRVLSARVATETLDLQYYFWHEDVTGRLLAREVLRAADRGVRVRLLLDDLYVRGSEHRLAPLTEHQFIDVRLYNPFRVRSWGSLGAALDFLLASYRLNHRMHNKSWIADGRLAIGGGRNIGDEYFDAASQFNFRDLDLIIEGGAAVQAVAQFERYWDSPQVRPLEALATSRRGPTIGGLDELRRQLDEVASSAPGSEHLARLAAGPGLAEWLTEWRILVPMERVRIVADPPGKARNRRRGRILLDDVRDAIGKARREVILVSPYFVPGRRGAGLLTGLARQGVRVAVLTNSLAATDVLAVHGGYARYRRRLLRAGVELHEFKRGGQEGGSLLGAGGASLHTKAFCVDCEVAFVGSFNFDPRSAYLNTEMGTFVLHPLVASRLHEECTRLTDPTRSWAVRLEGGRLYWINHAEGGQHRLFGEPETTLTRRVIARVLGFLPIEPHL